MTVDKAVVVAVETWVAVVVTIESCVEPEHPGIIGSDTTVVNMRIDMKM